MDNFVDSFFPFSIPPIVIDYWSSFFTGFFPSYLLILYLYCSLKTYHSFFIKNRSLLKYYMIRIVLLGTTIIGIILPYCPIFNPILKFPVYSKLFGIFYPFLILLYDNYNYKYDFHFQNQKKQHEFKKDS